ncbi:MAG: ABC transporter permease [Planctomycetota bacterium]|jgi:ribose transport system permease protein|nr:ABC transporter permease [Planctomycetota bacterium]
MPENGKHGAARELEAHNADAGGEAPLANLLSKAWVKALIALAVILIIGFIFNANGTFFRWTPHRDMLRQTSVYGMLACGMTVVIIGGGIDLSVGSLLAAVAVPYSLLLMSYGYSAWMVVPLCLLLGVVCGLVNGVLVGRFRFQPFIATLAMMTFARGLAKTMSGGRKVMNATFHEDGTYTYNTVFPDITEWLNGRILNNNLAIVTIIMIACMGMAYIILSTLIWGRYIYSIGGNEEAARLSGVPVLTTKLVAYGFGGLCCAIAGICQAAQEYQGDPEAGLGYELNAIGMVVIGGTSLAGGRGGIGLTFIGVLTMGYLDKILSLNAVEEASRLMLTAVIIVLAVLFQSSRRK